MHKNVDYFDLLQVFSFDTMKNEYPHELHHLHNDYPCAAEKLCVTDEMLSHYCQSIKDKFKISNGKVRKLIPTLYDKEKCVLHEENLKLYLGIISCVKQLNQLMYHVKFLVKI